MTPESVLVLWSDPAADQILLCNIWSYPHYSKCIPLSPSTLSLFRPWLPNAGTQGHCNIYCRLFPPGTSSNSLRNLLEVGCNIFHRL